MEKKKFNFANYWKNQKPLFYVGVVATIICLLASIVLATIGFVLINTNLEFTDVIKGVPSVSFERMTTPEEEGYDEGKNRVCPVRYSHSYTDKSGVEHEVILVVEYTYDEWKALGDAKEIKGVVSRDLSTNEYFGRPVILDGKTELNAIRNVRVQKYRTLFEVSIVLVICAIVLGLATFFFKRFSKRKER